jgi:hypothetical protein
MFSLIPLIAFIFPVLEIVLIVLAIYTLLILIKALQIYIRNNGWFMKLIFKTHFLLLRSNYYNQEVTKKLRVVLL